MMTVKVGVLIVVSFGYQVPAPLTSAVPGIYHPCAAGVCCPWRMSSLHRWSMLTLDHGSMLSLHRWHRVTAIMSRFREVCGASLTPWMCKRWSMLSLHRGCLPSLHRWSMLTLDHECLLTHWMRVLMRITGGLAILKSFF